MSGGGKGGGGDQIIGWRYFLGIHMGLCRGPVDQIVQIKAGDRVAWTNPGGLGGDPLPAPPPPPGGYNDPPPGHSGSGGGHDPGGPTYPLGGYDIISDTQVHKY